MEPMYRRSLGLSVYAMTVVLVSICWRTAHGHGRLIDPPARNSMWRFGFDNPVNYNDNELYCGGRMVQWLKNGGKCGVCGDSYHGDRPHEAGGKYANGIIAKTYEEGSEMDITVHLTANHLGFFEFRLCPNNNYKARVKQACLDKYLLERADGQGTRFYVPKGKYNAMFNYTLKLPRGLTCSQCVVQWKYRTGNTWDKEPDTGRFCLGCGPQEEFYNCADISIDPRRPAVIEYPTSQPDPPRFIPTINLPTVKPTAGTPKSIYTRAPRKTTRKTVAHTPPIMPPQPPPRKPHSETRPISKEKPNVEGGSKTSIFTTSTPWRRKTRKDAKTSPRPTTTTEPTTQTTTESTIRPTTTRRTTTTSTTTTTTTTTETPKTTTWTTKRKPTTTAVAVTKAWEKSRRVTQRYRPRKTTRIYTIFERKTWKPTTSQLGLKITPERPRNPFERLKTRQTVKNPFPKLTTVKYKYWTHRPYTDSPSYKTTYKRVTHKYFTQPTTTESMKTTTTERSTTSTSLSTTTTQVPTTTATTTTESPSTTQLVTTPPTEPTTIVTTLPTTEEPMTTTEQPTTTASLGTTEGWRSETESESVLPERSSVWVKWWTNKPEPTTTEPTRRSWTSPSLWWPPIWLPWTPWTSEPETTTTTTTTTTEAPTTSTTEVPPKTAEMWYPTSHVHEIKEGQELVKISDRIFGKIGSTEALPWYVGGDLTWKTWSPSDVSGENDNEITKLPPFTTRPSTTKPICLHSTTPRHRELHRDGPVKSKSPFQPPKPVRRRTYPPVIPPKTPPVWFRTIPPPVVQPVQPPPPSHHIWVKKNVRTCRAIIPLAVGMNDWCFVNCNSGFCPTKFCYCENKHRRPRYRYRTKKPPLWWKEVHNSRARTRPRFQSRQRSESSQREHLSDRESALQNIKKNMYRCKGIGEYSGRPEFDNWCQTNCRSVLCPLLICGCTWR